MCEKCCRKNRREPPKYLDDPANAHLLFGVILCLFGVAGLFCGWNWPCFAVAVGIDIYVAVLLVLAAMRGDGYNLDFVMPHRLFALGLLILLFIAQVSSFAGIYIRSGKVCQEPGIACIEVPVPPPTNSGGGCIKCSAPAYKAVRDGLYFSLVTITTVGYGDYKATDDARWYVMAEICSGALLLLLAFPLLVSRMADWSG